MIFGDDGMRLVSTITKHNIFHGLKPWLANSLALPPSLPAFQKKKRGERRKGKKENHTLRFPNFTTSQPGQSSSL